MPNKATDRDELPFIDAHDFVLPVDRAAAWGRLQVAIARSSMLGPSGFPEREAVAPERLRLAGSHPFATYELCFDLEELDPSAGDADTAPARTRVRATTHARFRRGLGRVYRAMVIGSGAHAWIMRRFLRQLESRAR